MDASLEMCVCVCVHFFFGWNLHRTNSDTMILLVLVTCLTAFGFCWLCILAAFMQIAELCSPQCHFYCIISLSHTHMRAYTRNSLFSSISSPVSGPNCKVIA